MFIFVSKITGNGIAQIKSMSFFDFKELFDLCKEINTTAKDK